MNKRKIISVAALIIVILLLIVYFLFLNKKSKPALNAVPADMIGFFEISDLTDFENTLNHPVWQELNQLQILKELSLDYQLIKNICATDKNLLYDFTNGSLLAAVGISKAQSVDYLFLLELDEAKRLKIPEFAPMIDGQSAEIAEHVFQKEKIFELKYPASNIIFSCATVDGIFLFSTSSVLVENAVLKLKKGNSIREDEGFSKVYSADKDANPFRLFINMRQLASYFTMFTDNSKFETIMRLNQFSNWLDLNIKIDDAGITLDGYASSKSDSSNLKLDKLTGVFNQTVIDVLPSSVAFLYQVNAEKLTETAGEQIADQKINLSFFDHWAPWMGTHYSIGATQSFDGDASEKYFVVIPANDTMLALNKLKSLINSDTLHYKGYKILEINSGDVLSGITSVNFEDIIYAAIVKQNFIFTNTITQLKNMLDAIEFSQTLRLNDDYTKLTEHLSSGFNASAYINFNNCAEIMKGLIADENKKQFDSIFILTEHFPQMEIQFSEAGDDFLVHGFISRATGPAQRTGLLWQTQLDAPVAMGPYSVSDRQTNQNKIIVQDTLNQLYLLSGGGNLIWKKQLTSKLLGEVYDVDFYGNHNTQLLFNTADGIYLFDMSGNDVEGFPIQLTSPSVSPVVVMNTGPVDYNMFIACANQNIYGFNKNGNPIINWNPMKVAGTSHYMMSFNTPKKNYLIVQAVNNVMVFDQAGKRIKTISTDGAVISAIGRDDNHFMFVDGKGMLKIFSPEGNQISSAYLSDQIISAGFNDVEGDGETDVIYIDDMGLHAVGQNDSLLFEANLEEPVSASIVIPSEAGTGVINSISGKIFLFDYNGSLRNGFPVNGSLPFVTGHFLGGKELILVTGNNNFIFAYRIE